MDYNNINKTIGENLSKYRKNAKITQLELAQTLNYSDKAISKWERGESLPDVAVLIQIAEIYGVSLNQLCYEQPVVEKNIKIKSKKTIHTYITVLSTGLVWLVATSVFAMLLAFNPSLPKTWLAFIFAIPVSGIVLVVFNTLWGKRIWNVLYVSIIIWGVLLSICLTTDMPTINWLYLIAIPLEILTIIWYCFKTRISAKINNIKSKNKTRNEQDNK